MKVRFGGSVRNLLGVKELVVTSTSLNDIFWEISDKISKEVQLELDYEEESAYLVVHDNGKVLKSWVVALYNGDSILASGQTNFSRDGELSILIPVGGG